MENSIKLYVVRFEFGAEVYGSLDGAKASVGSYLRNSSFNLTATIECWRSVHKITEGWRWISYCKRRVATREEFDDATEGERLEFFAKNFAKTHGRGYMREDVYAFSVVSNCAAMDNTEFYGSLNGRPINVDFSRDHQRIYVSLARF